ncbi:MAG: YXWGXW repeat-containing protein [Deltaproteobacteria bacterium]|nr:YXWGXW repeat-containing protein [Deltaproteobacteria bacterium]
MRKLVGVLIATATLSGCYAHGSMRVRGPNPFAVVATALTVAAVVNAVSVAPPVVTHVEYYDYGHHPGHIWVNGRYTYVNNNWVWQAGYWQPERGGHYWVQGAWQQQGNQYVWVDGYWAAPRQGHVYIDGYWDYRDTGYVWMPGRWDIDRPGHVYVGGSWTMTNNRRTWSQGRWERDDGRVEYARYRTRGRVNASGGAVIRDHR